MNKKLRRLVQPGMVMYFVVMALFCVAALVLRHYVLAAAEAGEAVYIPPEADEATAAADEACRKSLHQVEIYDNILPMSTDVFLRRTLSDRKGG